MKRETRWQRLYLIPAVRGIVWGLGAFAVFSGLFLLISWACVLFRAGDWVGASLALSGVIAIVAATASILDDII